MYNLVLLLLIVLLLAFPPSTTPTPFACHDTLYPKLCVKTLSIHHPTKSISDLLMATLNKTMYEVRAAASNCTRIQNHELRNLDQRGRAALIDCVELLDITLFELNSSISYLALDKSALSEKHYHRMEALLSAAMTNQYTCLDEFARSEAKGVRNALKKRLLRIYSHASNSLVMLKKIPRVNLAFGNDTKPGFPTWWASKYQNLLQTPFGETKVDLVVAKDGSGHFTTISAAVDAAPINDATRFVIYIKAGTYLENVVIRRKKIMLIGDGIQKTMVKAGRNVVDGWTTFTSATVAVSGDGFVAKGITFENTAKPTKQQAVAIRVGADRSAFYECSFVGHQDTIYTHSRRQFYRNCDVYGTVDMIFGNAAVVLQGCNLYARKPIPGQENTFTAHGRRDPNQNTGFAFFSCKIAASAELKSADFPVQTYLGRPWKEYSRTVVIRSNIEDVVDPAGWLAWNGNFALSTLYYGEYMNKGGGSNTARRVNWPGHRIMTQREVSHFRAKIFIQGDGWLPETGVPHFLSD